LKADHQSDGSDAKVANPEPHYFRRLNPDPHLSQNSKALAAQTGTV
jgi:hypothetical protein